MKVLVTILVVIVGAIIYLTIVISKRVPEKILNGNFRGPSGTPYVNGPQGLPPK